MKKTYPKFVGIIQEVEGHNKFVPANQDYFRKYLDNNTKKGQKYFLSILPYRKPRTTGSDANKAEGKGNQNGYYWAVVVPTLAQNFGLELWQMHEELKIEFMPIPSSFNPDRIIGGTTQKLDRTQWEDLMERIRVWAISEHNVMIPLPNEVVTDDDEDNGMADHATEPEPETEEEEETPGNEEKGGKEEIPVKPVDPINPLIELFEPVNPSFARLFANKNQRAAMERLLKQHGIAKLSKIIKYLPISNKDKFAPKITTPYVLEAKLGDLIAWANVQKEKTRKVADLGK